MSRRGGAPRIPEVLAVREDKARNARRAGPGRPASSEVLSVYLEGGPRYRLAGRTYCFTPPAGILIAQGTTDADLQEGSLRGVFALFRGRGLVRRGAGALWDKAVVALGAERRAVPLLKELSPAEADGIAGLLGRLAAVREAGVVGRLRRAALLLEAISAYCEAPGRGGASGSVHRVAARLRALIDEFAFENIPLARLYERLDVSAAHAGTLFASAFGVAPVAYRRGRRLRRARELLVSSQLNVSEVAYAVGFTDPLYFSRVFRRAFGVTPSSLIRGFSARRR